MPVGKIGRLATALRARPARRPAPLFGLFVLHDDKPHWKLTLPRRRKRKGEPPRQDCALERREHLNVKWQRAAVRAAISEAALYDPAAHEAARSDDAFR